MSVPENLRYAKTHEWVDVQADADSSKTATVGLSAFALEALTDLVVVDLPEVGADVIAGKPFGEVESVKTVSDLYSPVTGRVVEVNAEVSDALDRMSEDPYGFGWLVKIQFTDEAGLAELSDHVAYRKQCEAELED